MLEPYRQSKLDGQKDDKVQQAVEGADYYEVEAILDHKGPPGRHKYLVWWKGYPEEDAYWVRAAELNADDLLQKYWQ
ncbi:hypothetical protein ACQY0O_003437 [Thecaphora frezii]